MKLVIDLKITIASNNGKINGSLKKELLNLINKDVEITLYSICEAYTFEVISNYESLFAAFNKIILTDTKKVSDLSMYNPEVTILVGDSVDEELRIGRELGFTVYQVKSDLETLALIRKLKRSLKDD